MKTVTVVCCNDSIECAVAEGADKSAILERLAKEHFEKSKHNFNMGDDNTYENYRKMCYWHFHEVAVLSK